MLKQPTSIGLTLLCLILPLLSAGQDQYYWQQRGEYTMEIRVDAENHQFKGRQELVYHNNSPDTLHRVFYHLYFNAFQPGSMMDVRSRTIEDPDERVGDRILHLKKDEQGYHKIRSLKQDGKELDYEVAGTILEVDLNEPIPPGEQSTFKMRFHSQVPLQIRRSGRDNKEGVEFSMSQWYPKMAEYDEHGWHADPYVAREFHGLWSSFDVKITIDSSYVLGGTGYLQNPDEIGHNYQKAGTKPDRPDSKKLTWHFKAPRVHDFMWAADPDYKHDTVQVEGGPLLHFLYQPYTPDTLIRKWKKMQPKIANAFQYMSNNFGQYPYDQYSVIQGGDGGMEYPMGTLITGDRGFRSLVGVTCHELAHAWYHTVLATNENMHAWMDEGMTVYASTQAMDHIFNRNRDNPQQGSYGGYYQLAEDSREEPISLHADFYYTNAAYGIAAYSKGAVFVSQLAYIIGQKTLDKGLRRYFQEWQFKHPYPRDFKRAMEEVSGIQLDWYFNLWLNTTRTIDYAIEQIESREDSAHITLERQGKIPMPLDVRVTFKDGTQQLFYMPLRMMRGTKPPQGDMERTILEDWPWTHPYYGFSVATDDKMIDSIMIDPAGRMADVDRKNNQWPGMENLKLKGD